MWGAEREFRPNPQVRIRLEALETPELAARLKKCDPEAMKIITKNDRYRLIRALEIFELTGKKPSVLQSAKRPIDPRFRLFVIDRDPAELNVRIERRTRTMLEAGFLDEVKSLLTAYPNSRALSAVGYRQVVDHLRGKKPPGRKVDGGLQGLLEEITLGTRQLVKRQRTWNRAQKFAETFRIPEDLGRLENRLSEIYA
jgi:tRNA dimethylallyltransferase